MHDDERRRLEVTGSGDIVPRLIVILCLLIVGGVVLLISFAPREGVQPAQAPTRDSLALLRVTAMVSRYRDSLESMLMADSGAALSETELQFLRYPPGDTASDTVRALVTAVRVRRQHAARDSQIASLQSTAAGRRAMAAEHERAMRSEGCVSCRVWAEGPYNQHLKIYDPYAASADATYGSYSGYQGYWWDQGFKSLEVFSTSSRTFKYFEAASDTRPEWTSTQRDSIRREACRAAVKAFGVDRPCT